MLEELVFLLFFIFYILSCVYTMSYREELNEKLIDWKMSLETLEKSLNFISKPIRYIHIKL